MCINVAISEESVPFCIFDDFQFFLNFWLDSFCSNIWLDDTFWLLFFIRLYLFHPFDWTISFSPHPHCWLKDITFLSPFYWMISLHHFGLDDIFTPTQFYTFDWMISFPKFVKIYFLIGRINAKNHNSNSIKHIK